MSVGVRISQCMIVKNEEKNIERALSWGRELMMEQIVVDTGSDDRTVELAECLGAKVYHFPWRDDFAAAKNFAIEKASGDWIAFLDADEYFAPEDVAKIPQCLLMAKSIARQAGRTILNGQSGSEYADLSTETSSNQVGVNAVIVKTKLVNLNAEERVSNIIYQSRLFENDPTIRYEGRIHEHLKQMQPDKPFYVVQMDLTVYHTGYAWTDASRTAKQERNLSLLLQELEREPDSSDLMLYLAESYCLIGELEKSIYYNRLAIESKEKALSEQRLADAYQLILYNLYELERSGVRTGEFDLFFEQGTRLFPEEADFYLAKAMREYQRGNHEEALTFSEMAIEKTERMKRSADGMVHSKALYYLPMLYAMRTSVYAHKGDSQKAFSEATTSLEYDSFQESVAAFVIGYLTRRNFAGMADILAFLQRFYKLDQQKDLLFLAKASAQAGNRKLAECLLGKLEGKIS